MNKLPSNWTITKVGNLCTQQRGITYQKGDAYGKPFENSVWVLRGGNIQNGKIVVNEGDDVYVSKDLVKKEQLIKKGDVVIVSSTGSKTLIGKAAHAVDDLNNAGFGAFLTLLRPTKEVDSLYFNYFFQTEYYRENIRLLSGGININNIKRDHINQLDFPLAPLNEQKQISKKLDEVFGHLDELNTRLDRIPELIKAFKEKVLTYGVTGKLTEEWRKKHIYSAAAEVLLIKEQRNLIFERKLSQFRSGISSKPKQPKYEEYLGASIVDNWKRVYIEEIFDVETGGTPLRSNSDYWDNAAIPWVKSGEVNNNYIFEVSEYISEFAEKETNAKRFPIDTILIAMYGEGKTRGQVGILKIEAATNQAIAALVNSELTEQTIKYVYYYGLSQYDSIRKESVGGNQPNLNLNKIKKWKIDLPPLAEQKEIVNQIDNLFAFADKVLKKYFEVELLAKNLPKSILTHAFKGALIK